MLKILSAIIIAATLAGCAHSVRVTLPGQQTRTTFFDKKPFCADYESVSRQQGSWGRRTTLVETQACNWQKFNKKCESTSVATTIMLAPSNAEPGTRIVPDITVTRNKNCEWDEGLRSKCYSKERYSAKVILDTNGQRVEIPTKRWDDIRCSSR